MPLPSLNTIYENAVEEAVSKDFLDVSAFLLEYVKKIAGHKNSKGESAPWVIISHETGKILSSHKTKEAAEKHLQQMHAFKK